MFSRYNAILGHESAATDAVSVSLLNIDYTIAQGHGSAGKVPQPLVS